MAPSQWKPLPTRESPDGVHHTLTREAAREVFVFREAPVGTGAASAPNTCPESCFCGRCCFCACAFFRCLCAFRAAFLRCVRLCWAFVVSPSTEIPPAPS
eukprot:6305407-Pyramimonas_sp.AAC.1